MVPLSRPKRRSRAKIDNRKRAVYVDQACNLCKSRKTKCDGRLPCEHCQRRSLVCQYAKTHSDDQSDGEQSRDAPRSLTPDDQRQIGLSELTELVSALQKKVALLEHRKPNAREDVAEECDGSGAEELNDPKPDGVSIGSATSPVFAGPTSANFSLGVAKMILERDSATTKSSSTFNPELAGSASCWEEEEDDEPQEASREAAANDALPKYDLHLRDVLRLLQVYHECVGVLHPIVDLESLVVRSQVLWQSPHGPPAPQSPQSSIAENDDHLHMALAIALLAEGGGSSSTATEIHNNLQPALAKQMMAKNFTLGGQVLLLLAVFYQVFQDDHRLASRYVAIACRLMIEAGLHQRHVLLHRFPQSAERAHALTVLSTCVILDRQLNFNAGLPFTLKDADVDFGEIETLPPYIKAMAAYARIGPPAWAAVTDDRGKLRPRIQDEDFDYLDYQVRCWQDSLPEALRTGQLGRHQTSPGDMLEAPPDRSTQFLRYILYLRANQFKIVILRPLLFSAHTVRANTKRVRILAQIANDTIETITEMNAHYDLYRKQQPILNVFLSSAISTLFLVYIHGLREMTKPVEDRSWLSATARGGINGALELIRAYSTSRSSQRLWKKYSGQNGLLARLGFAQQSGMESDVTPSLHSNSSPSVPTTSQDSHLSETCSNLAWTSMPHPGYPPIEDLELFSNGNFQPEGPVDGLAPLQMFDMGHFLAPGDVGFLYQDPW